MVATFNLSPSTEKLAILFKKNIMNLVVFIIGVLCSTPHLCQATCLNGVYEVRMPTAAEAKIITNAHNNKRLLIARGRVPGQPRGINLKRLSWDWNLAKAAFNIAKTCDVKHREVHDKRFPWTGQNLFHIKRTDNFTRDPNWDRAVNSWFDEHKYYTFPQGASEKTGHYTQVVWAETAYVGCAYAYFPINNGKFKYNRFYVCNYGPGGNLRGRAPYKTGSKGCKNLC